MNLGTSGGRHLNSCHRAVMTDFQFDLEVRFTYRADEAEGGKEGKAEYKTFTFWSRVCAGEVQ